MQDLRESFLRRLWRVRCKEGITLLFYRRIFFAVAFCLLALRIVAVSGAYDRTVRDLPDGKRVKATGTVLQKEQKETSVCYLLTDVAIGGDRLIRLRDGGRILVYCEEDDVVQGSRVLVQGRLACFKHAPNEGNFDPANYYKSGNVFCSVNRSTIEVLKTPAFSLQRELMHFRGRMVQTLSDSLDQSEAGIMAAMITGDRSLLEDDDREAYQEHGIAHILAISGLHISVVGMGIYRLLRKRLCLGYGKSCAVSGAVILLFCLLSGSSVSTLRAVCMFLLFLGAELFGQYYDMYNGALWALLVLLMIRPLSVWSSGFWLSFGAVAAVIFIVPFFSGLLPDSLAFGVGIWIGMMPLTSWCYYQIPVYSVLLNLLILPLCTPLLGCGLAGALLGMVIPALGRLPLYVCHWILFLYRMAMQGTDFLPGGTLITGKPPIWFLLLFYAGLAAGSILWRKGIEETERKRDFKIRPSAFERRLTVSGRTLMTGLLAAMAVLFLLPVPARFEVTMLDVGQGDGIYLSSADGTKLMIDGGSTSVDRVGKNRILPFLKSRKVKSIDLWLVSHTDEDHISGLIEAMDAGYPIKTLVLSTATPKDTAYDQLLRSAEGNHTAVRFVQTGSLVRTDDFSMECLAPDVNAADRESDKNELSQIWLLKKGSFSMLFTGDAGEKEEKILLEKGSLSDVDVLKVGHHGSKGSSTEAFLSAVRPEYSLISVAEHNLYGHPSPKALIRLRESGSRIFMTKNGGQITLREHRDGHFRLHHLPE